MSHLPPPAKKVRRPGKITPRPARCKSALELPPGLQKPVEDDAQHDVDGEEQDRAEADRGIGDAQEAEAEARDDVEERVYLAYRLEGRREIVDRVEGAGEEREWRDHEIGHRGGMIELLRPDRGE